MKKVTFYIIDIDNRRVMNIFTSANAMLAEYRLQISLGNFNPTQHSCCTDECASYFPSAGVGFAAGKFFEI